MRTDQAMSAWKWSMTFVVCVQVRGVGRNPRRGDPGSGTLGSAGAGSGAKGGGGGSVQTGLEKTRTPRIKKVVVVVVLNCAKLRADQYGLTSRSQRCARAHPPRAVQGLDSHTLRAARGWMGGPRRRSDEGCVRRLTQRSERCAVSRQKSWLPHLVGFASEERG